MNAPRRTNTNPWPDVSSDASNPQRGWRQCTSATLNPSPSASKEPTRTDLRYPPGRQVPHTYVQATPGAAGQNGGVEIDEHVAALRREGGQLADAAERA